MEKNLTTGNIFKTIVYFALPYLLSYFLQTLYGMADLFIIGQFDHVDAITAVSNGSQVMHMLTVMIVGLAMGTTVSIARAVCYVPELLLLDEPFKGLDGAARDRTAQYLLRHRNGAAVLCVTHDRADAAALGAEIVEI